MLIYWKHFFLLFSLTLFFQSNAFGLNDRYRCMWQDDPATTMVIGWDQQSGHSPVLYYDVVDWGTDISSYNFSKDVDNRVKAKGMNNYFARLSNLFPNTVYYFILQDSEGLSRRMSFKTAPDNPSIPLSIIAGGDSRNHRTARRNANMTVAKLRPHCVMFGGDMTGGDDNRGWQGWMDDWQHTIAKDGRLTPIIPARGNHEESNQSIIDLFDIKFSNLFYGLTLGGDNLRIYTLNSLMATGGDQKEWLANDLDRNNFVRWKFAQYHYSIRPHTSKKSERNNQMKNWATLFYKYGVDLVCESDAHMVKTTYPIRPSTEPGSEEGFIRDDEDGTVYVGEGCWGAPLRRNNDDKVWTRASGSFNQFKWIFVYQDRVEIRTIETDDAASVQSVNPDDIFYPPQGLKIWNPPTGDVITIYQKSNVLASGFTTPSPVQPPVVRQEAEERKPQKEEIIQPSKKERIPTELPSTILNTGRKTKPSKSSKANKPKVIAQPKINPTEITTFNVVSNSDKISLSWKTKHENAKPIFEVQRSLGGGTYQTCARIEGNGLRHFQRENSYQFNDKILSSGQSIAYRLKHVLPNGSVIMSQSEKVELVKKLRPDWEKFNRLTPNPATGQVQFKYKLEKPTSVSIRLLNEENHEIIQQDFLNKKAGSFLQSIDISRMTMGYYLLIIESERKVLKKYLVKNRI